MEDFTVTVLGSSSATPTANRHHSSYILRFAGHKLMLDCGEGTQNRCLEYQINFQRIEYIFITHLHGDHFLGLLGLINTMNLYSRKQKLTVYGMIGLKEIVDLHAKISGLNLRFELEIVELEAKIQQFQLNERIKITVIPLDHRIPCVGFKFEETGIRPKLKPEVCQKYEVPIEWYEKLKTGENYIHPELGLIANAEFVHPKREPLIYVHLSDTKPLNSLTEWIAEADLLYHEATFLSNLEDRAQITFHSTALQAAEIARDSKVKKLIIGHFSSRYASLEQHLTEAKSVFPETELALEGKTFSIH